MCSPIANCMLLSAELQTHQLLLCAWITQKDLQETLCFRKFCDFPCTLCPQPWDFCAPRHSTGSTGWPLVLLIFTTKYFSFLLCYVCLHALFCVWKWKEFWVHQMNLCKQGNLRPWKTTFELKCTCIGFSSKENLSCSSNSAGCKWGAPGACPSLMIPMLSFWHTYFTKHSGIRSWPHPYEAGVPCGKSWIRHCV